MHGLLALSICAKEIVKETTPYKKTRYSSKKLGNIHEDRL
jgi:hypothetical protein